MADIFSNPQDREEELLHWVRSHCARTSARDTLPELKYADCIATIKKYGFNVLDDVQASLLDGKYSFDTIKKPFGTKGISSLYTISYSLLNSKVGPHADEIGRSLYNEIVEFMLRHFNSARMIHFSTSKESSLENFVSMWRSFKLTLKCICFFFSHMHQSVIAYNEECSTFVALGLMHFYCLAYSKFKCRLSDVISSYVNAARDGQVVDHSLINETIQMLLMMGIAQKLREDGFSNDIVLDTADLETPATQQVPQTRKFMLEKLDTLESALDCHVYTAVYTNDFEKELISSTRKYYTERSRALLREAESNGMKSSSDIPQSIYICNVWKMLLAENDDSGAVAAALKRSMDAINWNLILSCVVDQQDWIFPGVRSMLLRAFDSRERAKYFGINAPVSASSSSSSKAAITATPYVGGTAPFDPISQQALQYLYLLSQRVQHWTNYAQFKNKDAIEENQQYNMINRLCAEFKAYVFDQSDAVLSDFEAQVSSMAAQGRGTIPIADVCCMDRVLDMVACVPQLTQEVFSGFPAIVQAMQESLRYMLNKPLSKYSFPQMTASYCDRMLKGTVKLGSDRAVNAHLQLVIQIFKHFNDKDLFVEQHRLFLSKRLLQKKSMSIDVEKTFISLLKNECGAQFTSKIEGMISDLAVSDNIAKEFDEFVKGVCNSSPSSSAAIAASVVAQLPAAHVVPRTRRQKQLAEQQQQQQFDPPVAEAANGECPLRPPSLTSSSSSSIGSSNANSSRSNLSPSAAAIDFNVTILTTGHWPSARMKDAVMLPEMVELQQQFTNWYAEKFNNRVIKWVLALGEVIIKMTMKDGRAYEVSLLPLQAAVLKLFDESNETMNLADIQIRSGIADTDVVKRVLHSLCCQKYKLLLKSTNTKAIASTDTFSVNTGFSNSVKRFRVAMASLDESTGDLSRLGAGGSGIRGSSSGGGAVMLGGDPNHESIRKTVMDERGFLIDSLTVRIMKARKRLSHVELVGELVQQISSFQPDPTMIKARISSLIEKDFLERDPEDAKYYIYIP